MSTPEPALPDEAAPSAAVPPPSPGAMVKIARERAGLGVDDLAAQLKLSRSALEALEGDDFASLSEPVYVRGYYRKVAKTLGMHEDDVLEAYSALQPSGAAPIRTSETPLPGGIDASIARRGQGQGLLVAALIVAVSVGLLVMFANPERPEPLGGEPQVRAEQPAPAPVAQEVAPVPAETTAATAEPAPSEPEVQAEAPAPEPEPVAAAPEPPPPPPVVQSTGQIPEAATSARPTQLVLQFTEPSFVRIEDGGGRTLLIGLVRANETPVLDGEPPYSVFLGNAGNVRVFHGGKSVDFSGTINPQNQTARFTVP